MELSHDSTSEDGESQRYLTHPAWLIAFAGNTATDPIRRGKWIREKLLAGTLPDVPVTVDAVIPEDPHKTLRQRLDKVTQVEYCWKCHERMNPLGTAFEMYDDFGRFRTEESLEYPENIVKRCPTKARHMMTCATFTRPCRLIPKGN